MRDLSHASLRIVAVAALLIAKGPKRRQGRAAGQRGVSLHHALGIRARKKIIIQLTALGPEGKVVRRFLAKIETATPGIVEENAIRYPFAQADEKWKRLVNRMPRFAEPELVGVPLDERAIA